MFPDLIAPAQVMIFRLEEETTGDALRLATTLRAAGIATEVYPNVDKLGRQFQYAEARGTRLAAFIGGRERAAGQVALKVLATQQQASVKLADVVAEVRARLS